MSWRGGGIILAYLRMYAIRVQTLSCFVLDADRLPTLVTVSKTNVTF